LIEKKCKLTGGRAKAKTITIERRKVSKMAKSERMVVKRKRLLDGERWGRERSSARNSTIVGENERAEKRETDQCPARERK